MTDPLGTVRARTVLVRCGVAALVLSCGGRTPSEVVTIDGSERGNGPDGGGVPVPPGCEVVHFKSPIVELVIRWEVDIPEGPIPGAGFIDENAVTDLSPLSGKQHLVALSFWYNRIESLSGLVLPPPPEDQRCSRGLEFGGNPIPESEVRPFCEQGWKVKWGISGSEATPDGNCNLNPPCPLG